MGKIGMCLPSDYLWSRCWAGEDPDRTNDHGEPRSGIARGFLYGFIRFNDAGNFISGCLSRNVAAPCHFLKLSCHIKDFSSASLRRSLANLCFPFEFDD